MKRKIKRLQVIVEQQEVVQTEANAVVNDAEPLLRIPSSWIPLVGEAVQAEVALVGWCDVGSAVITSAGKLPNDWIIHAVGPRWGDANARGILAKVVWEILQLAEEREIKSLAMPPIATGSAGFPVESCARIMLEQIVDFAYEPSSFLRTVLICTEDNVQQSIFERELARQTGEESASGQRPAPSQ